MKNRTQGARRPLALHVAAALFCLAGSGTVLAEGVDWSRDVDAAFKRARREGRALMVDFWAGWCGWCQRLTRETYVDPDVVKLSGEFVAVRVNTEGNRRELELTRRYTVTSLPTVLFLTPEGRLLLRVDGFQGPGAFPQTLRRARAAARRLLPFEKALREDDHDAEALARLGQHLFDHDCPEESRELLQKAVKYDQRLPSPDRKRNRMLLALLLRDTHRFKEAETLFKEALALRPPHPYDGKLLYMLGHTYAEWGRVDDARTTLQRVASEYPRTSIAQKARESLVALDRR